MVKGGAHLWGPTSEGNTFNGAMKPLMHSYSTHLDSVVLLLLQLAEFLQLPFLTYVHIVTIVQFTSWQFFKSVSYSIDYILLQSPSSELPGVARAGRYLLRLLLQSPPTTTPLPVSIQVQ